MIKHAAHTWFRLSPFALLGAVAAVVTLLLAHHR